MSPHSCKSNHLSFIESHCSWKKIRPSQTKVRIVCLKILRERQIRRDPWIQIRAIFIAFRSGSRKRVRIIKSISQDFWPSCGPAFANSRSFIIASAGRCHHHRSDRSEGYFRCCRLPKARGYPTTSCQQLELKTTALRYPEPRHQWLTIENVE